MGSRSGQVHSARGSLVPPLGQYHLRDLCFTRSLQQKKRGMKKACQLFAASAGERPTSLCHCPLTRTSQMMLGGMGEATGYLVSTPVSATVMKGDPSQGEPGARQFTAACSAMSNSPAPHQALGRHSHHPPILKMRKLRHRKVKQLARSPVASN